ncbi:MAG: cation diffusion facilitator family transporter [Candidatus Dormibacteria bacterium]
MSDPTHEHDHGESHDHDHDHGRGLLGRLAALRHRHEPVEIDVSMEGSGEALRAIALALAVLGVATVIQAGVFVLSGSVGLLSDTIHNGVDALTAVPLALAFFLGRRSPNRRYTFGYGRAEDLAGAAICLMIVGSLAAAVYESVRHLLSPHRPSALAAVALAGLAGFAGNSLAARIRLKTGRRIGSAALVADGQHARVDGLTSLAVTAGAGLAWLGYPLADPVVGLLISGWIAFVVRDTVRITWERLMDAIEPDQLSRIEHEATHVEGVLAASVETARWVGRRLHAQLLVEVDGNMTTTDSHAVGERVRHHLFHEVPALEGLVIHIDPVHEGHDPHADVSHHRR